MNLFDRKKRAKRVFKLLKACSFDVNVMMERFEPSAEDVFAYNIIYGYYFGKIGIKKLTEMNASTKE